MLLLFLASAFADTLDSSAPKKGRPSHLQVESGTLITGSGAHVQLAKVQMVVPPKEQHGQPTQIVSGSAFLTPENLTTLIKDKLGNSKLENFKIETENGSKAKISATKKKAGIPLPISVEGPVTVTADGKLRMAISGEHVIGIPIKDLADALGMDPKGMVKSKPRSGFVVEKDAIFIDPSAMMGGSANSHVKNVEVTDKGLRLIFGEANKPPPPKKGR